MYLSIILAGCSCLAAEGRASSPLDRATLLLDLALQHRSQGRFAEADDAACEAARIRRTEAAGSHELANTLYTQAELRRAQGRFREAAQLLDEAGAEAAKFPDSPLPALVMQARAALLYEQQRPELAQSLQTEALAMIERQLGPKHPQTTTAVNNLGQMLLASGKHDAASALLERALRDWESSLGTGHRNVAVAANNLAQLRRAQGRLAEAAILYRRAIAIWQRALGPGHPDTAKGWLNLGDLFAQQGKTRGAQTLYRRALTILEASLGADHFTTRAAAERLARTVHGERDRECRFVLCRGARP